MESLGFELRSEAVLETLTSDVIKSTEIEGEILNPEQVRSSLARRLGMDISGLVFSDRDVDGVVDMMLDATQQFEKTLTTERLSDWHCSLFPTGRSVCRLDVTDCNKFIFFFFSSVSLVSLFPRLSVSFLL